MTRIPVRRRPTPEETATLLAAVAPLVPDAARSRRIRRAVGVTRNVSTIVTTVPFVPLPARVAAGALTGVATVVDAALRPFGERPAVPTTPPPDDDQILHDPALFAADAASALATGALAAGRALATGVRHPFVRRSVTVVAVAGVVISVGALGYRLVVGPVLERRRRSRRDAMALIVVPDEGLQPAPPVGGTGAPADMETAIDALAGEAPADTATMTDAPSGEPSGEAAAPTGS